MDGTVVGVLKKNLGINSIQAEILVVHSHRCVESPKKKPHHLEVVDTCYHIMNIFRCM